MTRLVNALLHYRPLVVLALIAWIGGGIYVFLKLDIEAYPDPSPPLVEVITQNPAWSPEEMEQQVTVPIETALNGLPRLQYIRSISIFGLSDVKVYFDFASDYFYDRQEVLNRLQLITLPANLSPQLSPWSPVGEIFRYQLAGDEYSLNALKATQDWLVRREIKQVSGIIDVTTFGGTTKQYQAEVDPQKLLQYGVTLPQIVAAVAAGNANAGGNYLSLGQQSVNIRGIGLLRDLRQMRDVLITERNGVPVFLGDVAEVHEGSQPRLGRIGIDNNDDAVEGIVLLQRGEQSLPALRALREKVAQLNDGLLPHGMRLITLYDRTSLIQVTTTTIRHVVLLGLLLVTVLLVIFLGDLRISLLATLTIPCSLLFAIALMVMSGQSANLISIGAIDFGILVDASVIVLENIYRRWHQPHGGATTYQMISEATAEAARPVLFSVLVIIVALIPLFTMRGVPGKIFAPMSVTYGFALTGALLFALLFAPVLASWGSRSETMPGEGTTRLVRWFLKCYRRLLPWSLRHRRIVVSIAVLILAGGLVLLKWVGGEFMPKLEEGNLWVRATLPQDVSFEYATQLTREIRDRLRSFPEVTHVISQLGRPDDGTDVTTFNNAEFFVQLRPSEEWPRGISKDRLVDQMNRQLQRFPGIEFNFSQNIQDNVEEAMSGVKGENSVKLFGDDINTLEEVAGKIQDLMATVPGIQDLAVLQETGQPQLLISIDREASGRYGLMAADVNAAVEAAIGGKAVTQILEGDRRFDFVVRYQPAFRKDPQVIRNITLPTPDGGHVPLGQVARVEEREGAFMIYRENGRRYIPIKFSVRGRDLASTMEEVQHRLASHLRMPESYHYEWAGEYDSLKKEQRRLAIVVPVSLLIILALLYTAFNSIRDAFLVMALLPFGAIGGVVSLFISRTPFSISAAVGFASVIGVTTLGGVVFLAGIRRAQKAAGDPLEGIEKGAMAEMRPVLMTCLAAGFGLLPAALSTGIGAQAQQPLARVVVGGMLASTVAILVLIPVFVSFVSEKEGRQ